ncbi:MAG: hypothetical protein ABSE63_16455 [Thermoguttaceae bacterium]|jgi:hypothetical protein
MNQERIFECFNKHEVNYLLIGGMNMLLRHGGNLTHDVDLWIEDTEDNRLHCHQALVELEASWGKSDADCGLCLKKLLPGFNYKALFAYSAQLVR